MLLIHARNCGFARQQRQHSFSKMSNFLRVCNTLFLKIEVIKLVKIIIYDFWHGMTATFNTIRQIINRPRGPLNPSARGQ